jgi:hypothetical protein
MALSADDRSRSCPPNNHAIRDPSIFANTARSLYAEIFCFPPPFFRFRGATALREGAAPCWATRRSARCVRHPLCENCAGLSSRRTPVRLCVRVPVLLRGPGCPGLAATQHDRRGCLLQMLLGTTVSAYEQPMLAAGGGVCADKTMDYSPLSQPCANDFAKGGMYSKDSTITRLEVRKCQICPKCRE